jgi:hypothetical protein
MKLRLFLLLASTLLGGVATARANCFTYVLFPAPGSSTDSALVNGVCIVGFRGYTDGTLRWDNNNSGQLQLFDTDDDKSLLWCPRDRHDCLVGKTVCLQRDGNMVLYSDGPYICGGTPLWASNTQGLNHHGEILVEQDIRTVSGKTGERVLLKNDCYDLYGCEEIWYSNNNDWP